MQENRYIDAKTSFVIWSQARVQAKLKHITKRRNEITMIATVTASEAAFARCNRINEWTEVQRNYSYIQTLQTRACGSGLICVIIVVFVVRTLSRHTSCYPKVQIAFEILMTHGLQFALLIALFCVLHWYDIKTSLFNVLLQIYYRYRHILFILIIF